MDPQRRAEHEEEEGPERIERIPGEMDSAMYSGSDEGEPTPGPQELGPPADRDEALRVFERVDELVDEGGEGERVNG